MSANEIIKFFALLSVTTRMSTCLCLWLHSDAHQNQLLTNVFTKKVKTEREDIVVQSTVVNAQHFTCCLLVILVTKNSESLLENIAGWRPECGWLGHRWVGYSCRLRGPKSVRWGNGLPLLALRHLVSLPVSTPLRIVNRCWSCLCKWWYINVDL